VNTKTIVSFVGATVLGGVAAYAGTILGGLLAGLIGLPTPSLPPGSDMTTLGQYMLLTSPLVAATLALVSRGLSGGFLARWLNLSLLTWIAYGVNTYLEATLVTTLSAASPFVVITTLASSLSCSAVVAWLCPPAHAGDSFWVRAQAFFAGRSVGQWAWRLLAALAAFPAAYIVFGMLVEPFVIEYYREQYAGLTAPTWGQIIPILLARSLLFLVACLPMLITWQRSRLSLFIVLGAALFMLVGGVYMLQSYWLPASMRFAHSLEIMADSFVHAGALVYLLVKGPAGVAARPAAVLQPHPHR
jgi:hypothetical protein